MDIFSLSASLTLDSSELESGLMRAQTGFSGISSAANSADNAVSGFASSSTASVSGLGASFESAWSAVQASWSGAGAYFSSVAASIRSSFSSLTSAMSGIGTQMWSGLKSGIDSAISGIGDWTDNIIGEVKSKLGIHSPSRVFAEIGRDMALGLDEGWNGTASKVRTDIRSAVEVSSSTVDFASSSLGKSSSAQINTMLAGMEQTGGVYSINLVVDGRTLANVVFDPLSGVAKQKGVAIGA